MLSNLLFYKLDKVQNNSRETPNLKISFCYNIFSCVYVYKKYSRATWLFTNHARQSNKQINYNYPKSHMIRKKQSTRQHGKILVIHRINKNMTTYHTNPIEIYHHLASHACTQAIVLSLFILSETLKIFLS